jgi:hypothetical protein
MWSKRLLVCFLETVLTCGTTLCLAQGSAGTGGKFEPRVLVDVPTAGMLDKGSLALDINFYQSGGALLGLTVGVFDRLEFGVSYGGSRLIGTESPVMNEVPGFILKVRAIEENVFLPALAFGFDSQGKDGYIRELSRYVVKSPGFFIVVSKNYSLLGFVSLHGGFNYSLERADGDKNANAFVGIEKTIGPFVSAIAEYNMAANDGGIGKGRGYLNAALKWSISGGLTLGINLKDLLKNRGNVSVANRTVTIEYVRFL